MMKNCFKKLIMLFIMTLSIILWNFTTVLAIDKNQSIQINNTSLNFNKVIYVSVFGNDADGDGTKDNPFKSLIKATGAVDTDNTLIYMLTPGTYEVTGGLQSLLSSKYALTYTTSSSNFGKIIIDLQNTSTNLGINMENLNKFIGLNFTRSIGGDNRVYEYFYDSAKINLLFSNCAFIDSPAITDPYVPVFSGNTHGCEVKELNFINCSFLHNFIYASENTYGYIQGVYQNCAFKDNNSMNYKSNIGNVNFDNIYNITSSGWEKTGVGMNPDGTQANIGVYGGEFAWGNWNLIENQLSLDKSSLTLNEGDFSKLTATTTPAAIVIDWSSSDKTVATVDSSGNVTGIKEGQATITAKIKGTDIKSTCIVTVAKKDIVPEPVNPEQEYIVNNAYAKGDNTNNANGQVSIIFKGIAEAQLKVVKTADVDSVYVGDNFTYTIEVTNTSNKVAKDVIVNDNAPNHIQFIPSKVITTQGKVDSSSTSKNIVVNVGDIAPLGKVIIKIPVLVVE